MAKTTKTDIEKVAAIRKKMFPPKKKMEEDLQRLAELKARLNPERVVEVPAEVLEEVLHYCEYNGIYDKLGAFGDFYYKIKDIMKK